MRARDDGLHGARRILVYGVTGSGKTTLAERLSRIAGIPWTAVDDLTWQPGWVAQPEPEPRAVFPEVCGRDSWILDSAYATWADLALARADLVVGLDYPRWRSLGRLVRRTVARNLDHRPICNGNIETWRAIVRRDSIIVWHFRSFARKHRRLVEWEADAARPPVLRLRSPRELEHWVATVAAECREAA
jgi:adenylate kinase family enzyme